MGPENELLIVLRINRSPQEQGGSREAGFEVLFGDECHEKLLPSFPQSGSLDSGDQSISESSDESVKIKIS